MQQPSAEKAPSEVKRRTRPRRPARARHIGERDLELLATVSHDFRTPLAAILGYADLLDMGVPETLPEASREGVRRIRTSAIHLLDLLNEVLAFARLDAGCEKANLLTVDPRDIVGDVAKTVEHAARARELDLQVDLPAEPLQLTTDPAKLHRLLTSLAKNAIRYTPAGFVRLALRVGRSGAVEFEVSDSGDGVAPHHHQRIFEPFWQLDPTQRARGDGTGLGLSIVKRLTTLLGGRITVRSELGKGSTFTVAFPQAKLPLR